MTSYNPAMGDPDSLKAMVSASPVTVRGRFVSVRDGGGQGGTATVFGITTSNGDTVEMTINRPPRTSVEDIAAKLPKDEFFFFLTTSDGKAEPSALTYCPQTYYCFMGEREGKLFTPMNPRIDLYAAWPDLAEITSLDRLATAVTKARS